MGKIINYFWNTPHYVSVDSVQRIVSYFEARNKYVDEFVAMSSLSDKMPKKRCDDGEGEDDEMPCPTLPETPIQIGVVDICGDLTSKPMFALCSNSISYVEIESQVKEMLESGVKIIVMNFDSGGGSAAKCFEFSDSVRQLCDLYQVPLYSYIDESACSAAYAWACIADEVYINPTAKTGSIGCVVPLLDTSEKMKMEGYKRIFITSGKNKVPFDDEGRFKQSFLDKIQKDVDKANNDFAAHVSKYTSLSIDEIKAMQAEVYDAQDALAKGLVNGVMTQNQFIDYITKKYKELNP